MYFKNFYILLAFLWITAALLIAIKIAIILMETNDKLREIDIKNSACFYFDYFLEKFDRFSIFGYQVQY